jgi:hypothetical protein
MMFLLILKPLQGFRSMGYPYPRLARLCENTKGSLGIKNVNKK